MVQTRRISQITPQTTIQIRNEFNKATIIDLRPLYPRREPERLGRVQRGAHNPLAIRWFGMTALAGHLRHLLAVTAASNQLDTRDWMRPEEAAELLDRVC